MKVKGKLIFSISFVEKNSFANIMFNYSKFVRILIKIILQLLTHRIYIFSITFVNIFMNIRFEIVFAF